MLQALVSNDARDPSPESSFTSKLRQILPNLEKGLLNRVFGVCLRLKDVVRGSNPLGSVAGCERVERSRVLLPHQKLQFNLRQFGVVDRRVFGSWQYGAELIDERHVVAA